MRLSEAACGVAALALVWHRAGRLTQETQDTQSGLSGQIRRQLTELHDSGLWEKTHENHTRTHEPVGIEPRSIRLQCSAPL